MTTTNDLGQEPIEVTDKHDDDLVLWSVTTIIDVLHKEGIVYWACEQTAEAAIDRQATWQAMLDEEGREPTVKWLRDARQRLPKNRLSDTKMGTVVHKMCEVYALTGEKPSKDFAEQLIVSAGGPNVDIETELNVAGLMLNQFDGWLQRFTPSYQATEVVVYNETYGYAGQCDAFLTIDGVKFIADYKSTRKPRDGRGQPKKPYPEQVGIQLGAYRNAEYAAVWRPRRYEQRSRRYYLLSPTERELAVPVPEVDTGLVIQITTEACEAYPIECGKEVHEAFLYCQEAFRWANETSKTVMGKPLTEGQRRE